MKITDYAPRAGALDAHLKGRNLIGVEVGCDVGAHAEALLRYCDVEHLTLIDLWEKEFYRGYCVGRLQSQGWKNNVEFIKSTSHAASSRFDLFHFDFIYIDITHDYAIVCESLQDWWPKLKLGGILGYRNYSASNHGLKQAIEEFIEQHQIEFQYEKYHNEMLLFKNEATQGIGRSEEGA